MRLLAAMMVLLLLFGCSSSSANDGITPIEPGRLQEVSFKDHPGRLNIIFNEDRSIEFTVWLKDLDPDQSYEISLINDQGSGGVIFGPAQNLDLKLGSSEGDTHLTPNAHGELYVSMLNPIRLFQDAEEVKAIIRTGERKIVTESYSFQFSKALIQTQ